MVNYFKQSIIISDYSENTLLLNIADKLYERYKHIFIFNVIDVNYQNIKKSYYNTLFIEHRSILFGISYELKKYTDICDDMYIIRDFNEVEELIKTYKDMLVNINLYRIYEILYINILECVTYIKKLLGKRRNSG